MAETIEQLTLPLEPAGNVAQPPMRSVIKDDDTPESNFGAVTISPKGGKEIKATGQKIKLKNKPCDGPYGHFVCNGPCGGEANIGVIIKGLVYCRKCAGSLKWRNS